MRALTAFTKATRMSTSPRRTTRLSSSRSGDTVISSMPRSATSRFARWSLRALTTRRLGQGRRLVGRPHGAAWSRPLRAKSSPRWFHAVPASYLMGGAICGGRCPCRNGRARRRQSDYAQRRSRTRSASDGGTSSKRGALDQVQMAATIQGDAKRSEIPMATNIETTLPAAYDPARPNPLPSHRSFTTRATGPCSECSACD